MENVPREVSKIKMKIRTNKQKSKLFNINPSQKKEGR